MNNTRTKIGSIRYIEDYVDAPKTAKYILRRLSDGSAILEKYEGKNVYEIKKFPFDCYNDEENFHIMLMMCRNAIGTRCIWVEKPEWIK